LCVIVSEAVNFSIALKSLLIEKELVFLLLIAMSFSSHITNISSKATRTLNFVKHKIYLATKCVTYISLVRPLMEYGSAVWDPYLLKGTFKLLKWPNITELNLIIATTTVSQLC